MPDGPPLATARAGNVIGGGDWSADRLIPDCVRALAAGVPVSLRYPDAVRPWQHVLEPLVGIPRSRAGARGIPDKAPRAINFGPQAARLLHRPRGGRRVQRALRRQTRLGARYARASAGDAGAHAFLGTRAANPWMAAATELWAHVCRGRPTGIARIMTARTCWRCADHKSRSTRAWC
jgi:hypothetical protein